MKSILKMSSLIEKCRHSHRIGGIFIGLYFNREGFSFNAHSRKMYTQNETDAVNKKSNLTINEEMPKKSAIPPQTP